MKAKIIIICFVMLNLFQQKEMKGQWVTIPDANFVAYLQANFPSCMNGNLMDTTCAGIIYETDMWYPNGVADLTGIQYFDSLKYLAIGGRP